MTIISPEWTDEEVAEYIASSVTGPFGGPYVIFEATIYNALVNIGDEQDGINAYFERKKERLP